MASLKEIEQNLRPAFSEDQAHVLATVIFESYNHLVRASDFHELKEVVRDLAEAQKELAVAQTRTETRVGELAQAQERTEKTLRNLARQVGGLSDSFGGTLEDWAIDLVPELLEKYWGLKIEDAGRADLPVGDNLYEFDLVIRGVLENQPVVVLGEVKSNLTASEVDRFVRIARGAAEHLDAAVRILFFGFRANREARERMKQEGAYMVSSTGKFL